MSKIQSLINHIKVHAPDKSLGGSASTVSIRGVEAQLGVQLPDDFKEFLQAFGASSWPEMIYGISSRQGFDIVYQTNWERIEAAPPLPEHIIPFSPDGWGNHYCLDTASHGTVIFWNHEDTAEQAVEMTHESFTVWLEDALASR